MATTIQTINTSKFETLGRTLVRYTLVIVLIWVGFLKFTAYEAEGIKPLVMNSPFLFWFYNFMSVEGFAKLLGIIEIVLGILIAIKPLSPKISYIGSLGSIIMFLITLSFLLSTPGIWQPGYGFPFLSPNPGQFIAKDIVLLAAAVFTAGESLKEFKSMQTIQE